ncbi:uncharacterized protein F5891DRAFT_950393 [Suillus fuscotomentosus]|uniref:Integrase core domain-containing protein n=1 Tax=Suillus fuscotomentosus TaxID=1912939 RepID=A0AAD4E8D5_9AGAM|nr:uncharacterized protein F5891DRAFT_950393 [Suillus fuscotomentosus]KAG1901613.1 hypothetical protein F5891DRAFT_950393 [Suillus fuscotomentosus]
MEEMRGYNRGSYIWGCSVHNIRIERLWVDWTSAVGSKWKTFFQNLEVYDALNPELYSHIWLLHYLFLDVINTEALQWANAWNSHTMTLPGQRNDSPHALRFFSVISGGGRGVDANGNVLQDFQPAADDLAPEEIEEYGIDWEAFEDHHLHSHHASENPPDHLAHNPFVAHWPEQHNVVEVEEPDCPLTAQQLEYLNTYIQDLSIDTMEQRHALWVTALQVCHDIFRWV